MSFVAFADDNAARLEAATLIGDILRTDPTHLQGGQELRVEVTNARGELLFTIVTVSIDTPMIVMPEP